MLQYETNAGLAFTAYFSNFMFLKDYFIWHASCVSNAKTLKERYEMMKILRIALPQETEAGKVFLGELLQSARWLGWEMPGHAKPKAAPQQASLEAQTGHYPAAPLHGKAA